MLELALREALSLGHNYIGTEHILLGLGREGDGVAVRILRDLDADAEKIRNAVMRVLAGPRRASHVSSETSIHVNPSAMVRRLLMSGAARALDGGRSEIEVADLLLALTRDEATSRLLTSLGVHVTAMRHTLEHRPPRSD